MAGWICFLALVLSGCSGRGIERAFDGEFSSAKNNRLISNYCQSCHVHKEFVPGEHIETVSGSYKRKFFQNASECRACHYLEKNFTDNDFFRKTRTPIEANKSEFVDFEEDFPEPGEDEEENQEG